MDYEQLKKDLITHKIYTAWQYIEYTEKNIATVRYCADTLRRIIEKMSMKTVRWQQDIMSDFVDIITEDGKKAKCLTVTADNSPLYELRVAGEKVNPWFLFDKLLRDFFQYTMNSFDSMSQIANAGLLANNGKKVDSVDIQLMMKCFDQQTYATAFPQMHACLDKIAQSAEFQYIEAINNRTKHTANIANKLSMGILGSSNTAQIGPFFRKTVQHDKAELIDQLDATIDFLDNSWTEFSAAFESEYTKDIYIENRLHEISGVHQQKLKDQPDQDQSYAYITATTDFASMPDEIRILLVHEIDDELYTHECPFDEIMVTGRSSMDILGRYVAEDAIGDDCLLHYRKYVKDKDAQVADCLFGLFEQKTIFYHANPYFNVESVSDDEEFLKRTTIPF